MPNPLFELFELICLELRGRQQFVLTERAPHGSLVAELRRRFHGTGFEDTIDAALRSLTVHFQSKCSALPFTLDPQTAIVEAVDVDFIGFVIQAVDIRSRGGQSKDFEIAIGRRLAAKLRTGDFHNIGWPRRTRTHLPQIVEYLEVLGFEPGVLRHRDKDGGLDLLWLPPLGTIPVRPLVSFQCKNARFSEATIREANNSAVIASRTIHRHTHMRSHGVYMCYVVFNDYLDSSIHDMAAGLQYAPLGLSDLASLSRPVVLSEL